MTQWYVKALSKLTQVSVQTLHHYDRIKLLEPSIRRANGYRLYSEKDLLRLQQIIALKYFGFGLTQIKTLLSSEVDMVDHFAVQSQFLAEKAQTLLQASETLKNIVQNCSQNTSISWQSIIQLIEVYRMTQQLENTWIGKVLSPEELKDYARFEQNLKAKFTAAEQKALEQQWHDLMVDVRKNVSKNPKSELGITFGQRCMDWVNHYYGKNIALRNAIWEKGLTKVKQDEKDAFSPECYAWLDEAISAYYQDRITHTLNKASKLEWDALLFDMYGDDNAAKHALCQEILQDNQSSKTAKKWLQENLPL